VETIDSSHSTMPDLPARQGNRAIKSAYPAVWPVSAMAYL
jgi:hypothetical protein